MSSYASINRSWWTSFIGKYVLTLFTTTHITRMKQLVQWTCSLVDNVPFAPFGSHEFDFLMCDFFSYSPPFPPTVFTDVLWTFGHITLDMSHFQLHNVPKVTP